MILKQAVSVLRYVYGHPANRDQRARAIARALVFQIRGRMGHRTITPIGSDHRMWAVLHHAAASKALYANPPDFAEMNAWRRLLGPGSLFVDVGSNVGAYALWAVDCGADVIAIEPSRSAAKLLMQNLALNGEPPIESRCISVRSLAKLAKCG